MPFQIIRNDITKVKADAIVNTANPKPIYGGGTDYAIYQAAGAEQLLTVRKAIGEIERGQAAETPAFNLNAKYIIHTVGPVWQDGQHGEEEILRNCYKNALALARKLKCKSIAFPLIGTGTYGAPKDKALQAAMSEIQAFLMEHEMLITLVVFSQESFVLSGKVFDNVREYVDNHFVEQAQKAEYCISALEMNELPPQERELLRMRHLEIEDRYDALAAPPKKAPKKKHPYGGDDRIDDLLAGSGMTFQEKLFEFIDARNMKGPDVYKGYISKQVYSKIQSDKDYHPNKFTALALCLSLKLDVEQTQDLIGRAGWTLSPSSKADLVVKGCIINKQYNLVIINIILDSYDCPPLEKIK